MIPQLSGTRYLVVFQSLGVSPSPDLLMVSRHTEGRVRKSDTRLWSGRGEPGLIGSRLPLLFGLVPARADRRFRPLRAREGLGPQLLALLPPNLAEGLQDQADLLRKGITIQRAGFVSEMATAIIDRALSGIKLPRLGQARDFGLRGRSVKSRLGIDCLGSAHPEQTG